MNNRHLTSEEMDALLMDSEMQERSDHLRMCPACAAEVEGLQRTLADLQGAVVASAAREMRVAVMPAAAGRTSRGMWGLVVATVGLCVAGPMLLHSRPTHVAVTASQKPQAAVSQISDAQLMSDIQQDLSSSVPQAMLPLAEKSTPAIASDSSSNGKENE